MKITYDAQDLFRLLRADLELRGYRVIGSIDVPEAWELSVRVELPTTPSVPLALRSPEAPAPVSPPSAPATPSAEAPETPEYPSLDAEDPRFVPKEIPRPVRRMRGDPELVAQAKGLTWDDPESVG